MTTELEMNALEETIEHLEEVIQSMEYDAELYKLEIVERGNMIQALQAQNSTLKKQLANRIANNVKVAAILQPSNKESDNGS